MSSYTQDENPCVEMAVAADGTQDRGFFWIIYIIIYLFLLPYIAIQVCPTSCRRAKWMMVAHNKRLTGHILSASMHVHHVKTTNLSRPARWLWPRPAWPLLMWRMFHPIPRTVLQVISSWCHWQPVLSSSQEPTAPAEAPDRKELPKEASFKPPQILWVRFHRDL